MGDHASALPVYDKPAAGSIAGTVTVLIVGILAVYGVMLDPTVVAAAVTLISFAASWVKTETKGRING